MLSFSWNFPWNCPWNFYCPWILWILIYGFSMGFLWVFHGFSMDDARGSSLKLLAFSRKKLQVMTGACISILIGHEGEISKARRRGAPTTCRGVTMAMGLLWLTDGQYIWLIYIYIWLIYMVNIYG